MTQKHGKDDDAAEKEWLFDFLLSVFRSPQWDVAVMGFIDEHCAVFDMDEENKLSYTTLHQQFKDLVRLLKQNGRSHILDLRTFHLTTKTFDKSVLGGCRLPTTCVDIRGISFRLMIRKQLLLTISAVMHQGRKPVFHKPCRSGCCC